MCHITKKHMKMMKIFKSWWSQQAIFNVNPLNCPEITLPSRSWSHMRSAWMRGKRLHWSSDICAWRTAEKMFWKRMYFSFLDHEPYNMLFQWRNLNCSSSENENLLRRVWPWELIWEPNILVLPTSCVRINFSVLGIILPKASIRW